VHRRVAAAPSQKGGLSDYNTKISSVDHN